ncbi:hypothetical protein IWQ60_004573 [Tieghemiomyces parasiticus]|uniref:Uncharacterized protein n=1 Tax=Tieghemiomyces parasiticus TaxID=78921 RepID=A0A9W8DZN2_9FUNG|nr:hypothetical protein IWQ60_004573 [Tieghemiomyces parasiticus]
MFNTWERILEVLHKGDRVDVQSIEDNLQLAHRTATVDLTGEPYLSSAAPPVVRVKSATSRIHVERPTCLFTLEPHWCPTTNLVTFKKVAVNTDRAQQAKYPHTVDLPDLPVARVHMGSNVDEDTNGLGRASPPRTCSPPSASPDGRRLPHIVWHMSSPKSETPHPLSGTSTLRRNRVRVSQQTLESRRLRQSSYEAIKPSASLPSLPQAAEVEAEARKVSSAYLPTSSLYLPSTQFNTLPPRLPADLPERHASLTPYSRRLHVQSLYAPPPSNCWATPKAEPSTLPPEFPSRTSSLAYIPRNLSLNDLGELLPPADSPQSGMFFLTDRDARPAADLPTTTWPAAPVPRSSRPTEATPSLPTALPSPPPISWVRKQFLTHQTVRLTCPNCQAAISTHVVPPSTKFRARLSPILHNLARLNLCGNTSANKGPVARSVLPPTSPLLHEGIHQCPECRHILGFIIAPREPAGS